MLPSYAIFHAGQKTQKNGKKQVLVTLQKESYGTSSLICMWEICYLYCDNLSEKNTFVQQKKQGMKRNSSGMWALFISVMFFIQCNNPLRREEIVFFHVPLKCGAAPGIGCGSRIKPLFMDTEKENNIKESWTNREGTVLAIVGKENADVGGLIKTMQPLFENNNIEAEFISEITEQNKLLESLHNEKDGWLKGMEVDKLSIEEAGIIARDLTQFAEDENLISHSETEIIRKEIEEYFKKELVMVRTYDELMSAETQEKWMRDGYAIYEKHIGRQRADIVSEHYKKLQEENPEDKPCCDKKGTDKCCKKKKEISLKTTLTCPECGHKKDETLPTEYCLLRYNCEKCKAELFPKEGDCCVFCSYGTVKCPSKQNG